MSLISKLKAVVAGDEYLDDDFDELDYESEDQLDNIFIKKYLIRIFLQKSMILVLTKLIQRQ